MTLPSVAKYSSNAKGLQVNDPVAFDALSVECDCGEADSNTSIRRQPIVDKRSWTLGFD